MPPAASPQQPLRECRAVVIGAGLAGLSAAIALAARGARVRVLEAAPAPGGRAARLRVGQYTFDLADETLTHPQVLGPLFALADLRLSDFLDFVPVDPLARALLPDGASVDLWRDPFALAGEIARTSPRDAERLARDLRAWEARGRALDDQWFRRAGGGMAGLARAIASPALSELALAADPRTLTNWLSRRYQSRAVRDILAAVLLRSGRMPERAPAATRWLAALELARGAWAPVGGPGALVDALLRVANHLGVQIVCNCEVEKIEFEGGAVRNVVGRGFKPLRADIVVSTLAPVATLEACHPRSATMSRLARRRVAERPSRSLLVFLWGCSNRWPALDRLETVVVAREPAETVRQLDDWRVPAAEPPLRVFNPTVLRSETAPLDGCALKVLVPVPALTSRFQWNADNVAPLRARVVKRLEAAGATDLGRHIAEELIVTPMDWARRLRLPGGALYGPAPDAWPTWLVRAPNRVAGVRGLYQAGKGAHPGPPLAGAIQSGLHAAQCAEEDA